MTGISCSFCGGIDGRIQHVDIAWPGGAHRELYLHPECEEWALEKFDAELAQFKQEAKNG